METNMSLTYKMSVEEAEQIAIDAGSLEPQTLGERTAAGIIAYNYGRFANTQRAIDRHQLWTQAILNGVHPSNLKGEIG
jgi:hypothetical protein